MVLDFANEYASRQSYLDHAYQSVCIEDQCLLVQGLIQSYRMWQEHNWAIEDTHLKNDSLRFGDHLASVIQEEIEILRKKCESSARAMESIYKTASKIKKR